MHIFELKKNSVKQVIYVCFFFFNLNHGPLNIYKGANVYWIGLSDIHKEGTYRWEGTGEAVSFSDWAHNQPDNHKGHEDCTHLWKYTGYRWNDLPCNFKGGYICQKIVAGKSIFC